MKQNATVSNTQEKNKTKKKKKQKKASRKLTKHSHIQRMKQNNPKTGEIEEVQAFLTMS